MLKSVLTGEVLEKPIYHSTGNKSITSLSQLYDGPTVVYYDERVGHLQTREIESIDAYYDQSYQFYNQSDEDDILYKIVNGVKVYRQQHQVDTLLKKLDLPSAARILDYGCAKGTVMKRLARMRTDVVTHLFDVSQMYVPLWERFLRPDQYASYNPRPEWLGTMDVITSFFAFEHTPDPVKELQTIRGLLKPGGMVYLIVPNVFANVGDFIVVDHIHHYSEVSLRFVLAKAGFDVVEIDDQSHFAAFIAIGKKNSDPFLSYVPTVENLKKVKSDCTEMAGYWDQMGANLRSLDAKISDTKIAIYGAGVYGNFIATRIADPERIACFIDQNQLLHGTKILGKPVLPPDQLPADIHSVYVGINPKIAREAISDIEPWRGRSLNYVFL